MLRFYFCEENGGVLANAKQLALLHAVLLQTGLLKRHDVLFQAISLIFIFT